ncbi:thiamine pyrophosphate-binding protein [Nocardioides sp. DS6]|uniref:Thiamine pyrophosphate-binding protein n=1 Tax=Nocardioides eburneus TaxID=3231482 RepID=A0ABV3SZI8_9ACTN
MPSPSEPEESAMVNGGELVVRTLQAAGVTTLFGLHGAHTDTVFQACRDHELRVVDTRHEASAGHAAEGYARAGRRLGVALVTAGGGFTNVVTSLANAWLDRTPVLYLTGSGPLDGDETNTLQAGIDQVAVAAPITKWAHRVTRTDQIPRLVAQAIRIALTGPRGPVLLDIPWDVLTAEVEDDVASDLLSLGLNLPRAETRPAPEEAGEAVRMLAAASRPVVVAGSELQRSPSGVAALRRLTEMTGIPVFADFEGMAAIAETGESYAGLVQGLQTFGGQDEAPDVVLMLGARFGLNTGHGTGALVPLTARVIQVDPDGRELGRLQQVALPIHADAGGACAALVEAAAELPWPDRAAWRARVRELVDRRRTVVAEAAHEDQPIHPFHAAEAIAGRLGPEHVVVADGALTYLWLSEVISRSRPAAFLCHGYLGSMGVGTGTALGAAAVAGEGRRTVLVTGDGAIGYAIAEFDTMVRHRLPVVVVVVNNRSWGGTLHYQMLLAGPDRITNTRLENGAYEQVAEAFGAEGYYATSLDELDKALERALARDVPACINVVVGVEPVPPEEQILIGRDPFAS